MTAPALPAIRWPEASPVSEGPPRPAHLPLRAGWLRHARNGGRRMVWTVAGLALLLDVAVCLPFIYDPLGWLEPSLAAPGAAARAEYVVFLAGERKAAARAQFFAAHPELRVEHEGGWAGTMVVSLPAAARELAGELRGQPFVRLMTRSGTALCRAT